MPKKGSVPTFFVTGFALLLTWANPTYAIKICEVEYLNNREARLRVGSSYINVIGWEHLLDSRAERLVEEVKIVLRSAETGMCSEANNLANAILHDLAADFQNASLVFDRLSSLNRELPLTAIGVELSPEELQSQMQMNIRTDEFFAKFRNLCVPDLQAPMASLRLMIPGPEFEFHRLNENISLVGLEDPAARDANLKDFEGVEQSSFDFNDSAITPQSQAAIEAIRQSMLKQNFPSDSMIQTAVAFEKDSARRVKHEAALRSYVVSGMRIIAGAYKRNVAIASELMRLQGNIALPIGFYHVDHLVGEILRQCRAK